MREDVTSVTGNQAETHTSGDHGQQSGYASESGAHTRPKSRLFAHTKTGPQLTATKFPPRQWLIDKVIPHPSISMIYAKDGVGKTWTAMALSLAAANAGPWLHPEMCAQHPRVVIHIDGEMTEELLQERFLQLNGGPLPDNLRVLSLAAIADDP